ncbi:MAG: hypothetical protein C4523_19065 [Myxococcales bacterium]|nr:MAG: hypothetical protein C4523_19065 [Myxococcales bacterium]
MGVYFEKSEVIVTRRTFICDAMLGRLAVWLRLWGYDCAFDAHIADDDLIRRAGQEGRVLLTRDRALLSRRAARALPCFFVAQDGFREQLAAVAEKFGLDASGLGTRCSRCNTPLEETSREAVRTVVPYFVGCTADRFARCPSCGRVYWRATHHRGMEEESRAILAKCASSTPSLSGRDPSGRGDDNPVPNDDPRSGSGRRATD